MKREHPQRKQLGPVQPGRRKKKVLLNAIKLLTMTAPETINSHPLDQLIAEAVNDFIKSIKGAWPP